MIAGDPMEGQGPYDVRNRWLGAVSPADGSLLGETRPAQGSIRPQFSRNGRYFMLGTWLGVARIIDRSTGEVVRSRDGRHIRLAMNEATTILAEADRTKTRVFSIPDWTELFAVDTRGTVPSLAFDPSGRWLALGGAGMDHILIVTADSGRRLGSLPMHRTDVNVIELSHDGKRIYAGTSAGDLLFWNVEAVDSFLNEHGVPSPLNTKS